MKQLNVAGFVPTVGVEQHQRIHIHFGGAVEQASWHLQAVHTVSDDGCTACLGDSGAGIGRAVVDAILRQRTEGLM